MIRNVAGEILVVDLPSPAVGAVLDGERRTSPLAKYVMGRSVLLATDAQELSTNVE
jgi:hypothetical protein